MDARKQELEEKHKYKLQKYIKVTDTMEKSIYFCPYKSFTEEEIEKVIELYNKKDGIIDMYLKTFPERTLQISVELHQCPPHAYNEYALNAYSNNKWNIRLRQGNTQFVDCDVATLAELSANGLFETTQQYNEYGFLYYFTNTEKELLKYLYKNLEYYKTKRITKKSNEDFCYCGHEECQQDCGTQSCGSCIDVCRCYHR